MSPRRPPHYQADPREDYRSYFEYSNEEEDGLFHKGYETDFRYFSRSRYEEEDLEAMEGQDTMGWSNRGQSQAQEAAEGSALDGSGSETPLRPKSISELEEERRLQEFEADPGGFIEKEVRGLCDTVFQMKVLAILILVLIPFAQYTITPLADSILFGYTGDSPNGIAVAVHYIIEDAASPAAYNLPSAFYAMIGMILGVLFFMLAVLPKKVRSKVNKVIFGVIAFFYIIRGVDIVQPGTAAGGASGAEAFLLAILVFILVILAACYLIVAELGIMFFIAGPSMAGIYGVLKSSPRAIKFSFFLFVLYIFDAAGTLSEHFVSFVFFGVLLFAFVFLGLSIGDVNTLHKENKERVTYRGKRMVMVPGVDRNLGAMQESLEHHASLLLANLGFIIILGMFIFFSSDIIALFLGPALSNSLEVDTAAGKLISISVILFILMLFKLFFGPPSDQIDRKVFKRRRLERILSEKKNTFYVETVSEEQQVHEPVATGK